MDMKSEIAKNNIIFSAGNIAAALLSFVFSIVIAGLLGPEQFGLFSFALVVMGFFTIFVDLGISNIVVKFMSSFIERGENSKAATVVGFFFRFKLLVSMAIGLVMLIFSDQISAMLFNKPGNGLFIMLASGLILSSSMFDFVNMVLIGLKSFRRLVALRLLERVFRISFAVVLVLSGLKAVGAVYGLILGFMAVIFAGWLALRKYSPVLKAKGEGFQRGPVFRFSFWASFGAIILSIYMMVDALMISMMLDVESVGFYSIAVSWMSLIIYMAPISSIVMYSYFSSFDVSRSLKALQISIKYALIVAVPAAFLMSSFSAPIISIFYSAPFAPAASALSLLSIASISLVMSPLILGYLYGLGKPRLHTTVILCVLSANVVMIYAFITAFGIWGAAAATLLARFAEISIFTSLIWLISRDRIVRWGDLLKPLLAGCVIYIIASALAVNGLTELIAYGLGLFVVYVCIMLMIHGMDKKDITTIIGWIKENIKY